MTEKVMETYIYYAGFYNVHPPESKNGYPIWYQSEEAKHPKFIFLRHGLFEKIVKLNDSSYVAEPTLEYAYTIYQFSGNYEQNSVIYIIPDSNVTYYELREFCDELSSYLGRVSFNLVSSDLKYFPVQWLNMEKYDDYPVGCGWGNNLFTLKMNTREQMLIEGERKLIQHVRPKTYEQYSSNINGIRVDGAFVYRKTTYEDVENRLHQFEQQYDEHPRDFFYAQEIVKLEKVKWWTKIYTHGEFNELNSWDMTDVDIIGNTMEVKYYYDILGEYFQGLKSWRELQSQEQFHQSYDFLLCTGQFEKVRFLDYQFKHNVTRVKLPWMRPLSIDDLPKIPSK